MIIQHNLLAQNADNKLKKVEISKQKAMEKLSSGYRVNRAADDAAGLSISEKMRAQIRGLDQAARNTQDGISLIQVADGALSETHEIIHRIRELAVKAANDTNVEGDRRVIKKEIDALAVEIDRVAYETEFNNQKLLDGSFVNKAFQVGANANQMVQVNFYRMDTHAFGFTIDQSTMSDSDWDRLIHTQIDVTWIGKRQPADIGYVGYSVVGGSPGRDIYSTASGALLVNTAESAEHTLCLVDGAIEMVSQMREHMGALQNRLEHAYDNQQIMAENLTASESKIRDANMAKEMVEFSKNDILSQAGMSMIAQASRMNEGVLSLLR